MMACSVQTPRLAIFMNPFGLVKSIFVFKLVQVPEKPFTRDPGVPQLFGEDTKFLYLNFLHAKKVLWDWAMALGNLVLFLPLCHLMGM